MIKSRMREYAADLVLVRDAEKQTARPAKYMTERLAPETNRRRVDDWQHLFNVAGQQRIKQSFVGVLQATQKHVFLQVARQRTKCVEPPCDLVFEFGNMWRQEAVQLEEVAFAVGERRTFVEQRIIEQFVAAQNRFDEIRLVLSHCARPLFCSSVPCQMARVHQGPKLLRTRPATPAAWPRRPLF